MPRETAAARRARAARIVRRLAKAYPDVALALQFRNPWELLVATILSAQCTDKKVNEVTPALFRRFPTPHALAEASAKQVEQIVRPTGFYRQKTRSIQSAAREVVDRFRGEVPGTIDELTSLPGVARKTANIVLGSAFDVPGLAVDTHMRRVNHRLGLTRENDPDEIERDLMDLIPKKEWTRYTLRVIHHGRVCCDARRPACNDCPVPPECPWPTSREGRARVRAA